MNLVILLETHVDRRTSKLWWKGYHAVIRERISRIALYVLVLEFVQLCAGVNRYARATGRAVGANNIEQD